MKTQSDSLVCERVKKRVELKLHMDKLKQELSMYDDAETQANVRAELRATEEEFNNL